MIVSAVGHGGLLLWALVGGLFNSHDMAPTTITTEVSLMSSAEFEAMAAAAPKAPQESPPAPVLPEATAEPAPDAPQPEPQPEAQPAPEAEAQPQPDPAPDVTELEQPETQVTDTPPSQIQTPVEEPSATMMTEVAPRPKPRPAPRVAPTPSEAPAPDAQVAEAVVEETTPEPAPEADPLPEPPKEAAPPEAGEVLETEENKDQTEFATSAPASSARPKSRPAKPAPAPEPQPEPAPVETETAAVDAPEGADQAGVADALAQAMAGEAADEASPGTGVADSGPPITSGEKDALVVAVKQCWNVGALSTDALRTVVTIRVSMGQDGKPDSGSIELIGSSGGDDTSVRQAFEAGRRAIIRCAGDGYPLPAEKYAQWREIEIEFNPERMRMK